MVRNIQLILHRYLFVFQHLYLVYTDDNGNEFTISGQRETNSDGSPVFLNPDLVIISNQLLQSSKLPGKGGDFRPNTEEARIERHHTSLNSLLNGRDANVVWQQMVQHSDQLRAANIPYDIELLDGAGESDNSNTTVVSVLNAVGIKLEDLLSLSGLSNDDIPGSEDLFSEYADLLDTNLVGSDQNDILRGGFGDDFIEGGVGQDTLTGAVNLPFEDTNDYEIDFLTGGIQADTFILGEEGKLFYAEGNDFDPDPPDFAQLPVGNFITPKDFVILSDFNPQNGDKIQVPEGSEIAIRTIKNDGLIAGVAENSSFNISGILSPDAFSTTVIDANTAELLAVIPLNGLDGLNPGVIFETDTIEFV